MRYILLIVLIGLVGCTTAFEKRADHNFAIIQNVLNGLNQRLAKLEGVELPKEAKKEAKKEEAKK